MPGVVPQKPACRHCGATVRTFRKCPRCGKRAWPLLAWWLRQN